MPNFEKLIPIIEWLEQGAPHVTRGGVHLMGFDYSSWLGEPFITEGAAVAVDPDNRALLVNKEVTTGQCGSTGCIAGALLQWHDPKTFLDTTAHSTISNVVSTRAADMLDISHTEAALLFWPFDMDEHQLEYAEHDEAVLELPGVEVDEDCTLEHPLYALKFATPQQVARVLRHWVATGIIDWHILEEEEDA